MAENLTLAQAEVNIVTGLKMVRDGWHCKIVAELKGHYATMEAQEERAVAHLGECMDALENLQEENQGPPEGS